MSPVECLRELINERLTAAAEEIFTVCQTTLVEYQKEIDRQGRLLDIVLKPELKLHRTGHSSSSPATTSPGPSSSSIKIWSADYTKELPQHVCKEEEVLADQQLCDQERNSSLDQDDLQSPQIKEEQEELCTGLEREQLVLKQEMETFLLTPTYEDCDNSEDQMLDLSPDETLSAAEKQLVFIVSGKGSVGPEPNRDDQLLSHNSHVAESQDHKGGKHETSGSTGNAETRLKKRCHKSQNHTKNTKSNSNTLKIHSNIYTGKQQYECDTCGKVFKYKSRFQTHLRVHTGEKPYPCNTCEKRFSLLGNLKEHMRTHTGEKPYTCNTCERRYSQLCDLNKHMRIHTGDRPYPCNTCEKRFLNLSCLKSHMRVHTGERPYPCNTCEKRFSQLGDLNKHMRTHTGEKPYPCNTCEKRFSQLRHLNEHIKTHTGNKPYACNTCEKKFSCTSNLKVHMRVHRGEKPYLCNTCEKRFSQLCTLKVHMRIHTGEKPYNCKTCGREFRYRSQLKDHMRTHTEEKDSVRCQT